jgi:hypothetical protein
LREAARASFDFVLLAAGYISEFGHLVLQFALLFVKQREFRQNHFAVVKHSLERRVEPRQTF